MVKQAQFTFTPYKGHLFHSMNNFEQNLAEGMVRAMEIKEDFSDNPIRTSLTLAFPGAMQLYGLDEKASYQETYNATIYCLIDFAKVSQISKATKINKLTTSVLETEVWGTESSRGITKLGIFPKKVPCVIGKEVANIGIRSNANNYKDYVLWDRNSPFRNKTAEELHDMFIKKGFREHGTNPKAG